MKKETWIELIVGIVILGGLGYLSSRVMDMSQQLGSVDSKVSLTTERLDRIAQALPDVGVRVAQEEVMKPIRTIVLTSNPIAKPGGGLCSIVSVFDLQNRKAWRRTVDLKSRDDKQVVGALAWVAADLDPQYASVSRMQQYARTASGETGIPASVNASTSFVLRSVSGETLLDQTEWFQAAQARQVEGLNGDDWDSLARSLRANEHVLMNR